MSTQETIKIDIVSQSFYRDFYYFHKNLYDAWYIKDASHNFLDASSTFLSRFLPDTFTNISGLSDTIITGASEHSVRLMYNFEERVNLQKKELTLLASGYYTDKNAMNVFILTMHPYKYEECSGVFVFLYDLDSYHKKIDWRASVIHGANPILPGPETFPLKYENPLACVTEKEWEVVWLVLCGYSIRWVAEYLNIRSQAAHIKMRNAYMKFGVTNRKALLQMAAALNWLNFVPKRFVSEPALIRLSGR